MSSSAASQSCTRDHITHTVLQSQNLPEDELLSILKLLLSPALPSMLTKFQAHRSRLRQLAVKDVTSAEEACLAHIRSQGELSPTDGALQDKVSRAAHAAAAVDGLLAQVWQCVTLTASRLLHYFLAFSDHAKMHM